MRDIKSSWPLGCDVGHFELKTQKMTHSHMQSLVECAFGHFIDTHDLSHNISKVKTSS